MDSSTTTAILFLRPSVQLIKNVLIEARPSARKNFIASTEPV